MFAFHEVSPLTSAEERIILDYSGMYTKRRDLLVLSHRCLTSFRPALDSTDAT